MVASDFTKHKQRVQVPSWDIAVLATWLAGTEGSQQGKELLGVLTYCTILSEMMKIKMKGLAKGMHARDYSR